MTYSFEPHVAIVDYGLGNLFSVKHACRHVGMKAEITSDRQEILAADAVMLPGVGAFGDAMDCLKRLDLVGPLREVAARGTPLVGICLGLQLLMSESHEFGRHAGLDIIPGDVVRFDQPRGHRGTLKVPQVGWERIYRTATAGRDPWADTPLAGQQEGECMYFVHSFYVRPQDPSVVLSRSRYGHIDYCSAVRKGNIFAFQYHPERSGEQGLRVYRTFREMIVHRHEIKEVQHAA